MIHYRVELIDYTKSLRNHWATWKNTQIWSKHRILDLKKINLDFALKHKFTLVKLNLRNKLFSMINREFYSEHFGIFSFYNQ